jgi:hypothetical protein
MAEPAHAPLTPPVVIPGHERRGDGAVPFHFRHVTVLAEHDDGS